MEKSIFFLTFTVCPFEDETVLAVESAASQAAITVQNMRYVAEIKNLFHSVVKVMSSAVDERTPYNGSYTRHMAQYGSRFLNFLNERRRRTRDGLFFTPAHKEEIIMSIWFHDIGKLVTPLDVMNKISCPWLEPEEYAMLSIRRDTLSSEEREIMEEQVPYKMHIITILDIFDALVADDWPYKPGIPIEKALNILTIMAEKEGKLDPQLTALFIESKCWLPENSENLERKAE